jgi:acetolactate synthase-1/2/3 large subunit
MKVSDVLVRCLENEGVRYVFGVPGEENEDLLFSLERSGIEFVPTRHEQGAAFIANVWGRLTGRAGVCLSTLGPGATNLLTGVADANLDKAPLVALTAQGGTDRLHHESHQYLDIVAMFSPVTKWNAAITSPDVVTEVVRKAFKVAEIEKPGAAHLELSEDLAAAEVTTRTEPIPSRRVRRPGPDYRAIEQTLDLLRSAERPLILAGNGAIRKRASKHLTRLVERHGIPVASTFMGKGAVSDERSQSLWSVGLGFKDYALEAFDRADLVLAVGYDIAEYAPERWNPSGRTTVVHVDFQPAEVYTHYRPKVEIVCDVSAALWELHRTLESEELRFDTDWFVPIRERIVEDVAAYGLEDGEPFTTPGALNVLRRVLPKNGLLISDVGSHKMWIARNFPTYCPNGCIVSNGLASMGIALPGGIAAALVDPERPVVAAMGDGGFMMNSQELETAKRLGVGFTCIVFNDNDYGLISWKQIMSRGRSVSTRIGNPDLVRYAESFGIEAYRPDSPSELAQRLEDAIGSRKLCLIEIPVDPSVNQQLVDRLETYWSTQ